MNIVRLGHYFNPGNLSCQWATVVKVVEDDPIRAVVNLKVIDSDGDEFSRLNVRQDDPLGPHETATFHLSSECPWHR